jgi:hypothetical protein
MHIALGIDLIVAVELKVAWVCVKKHTKISLLLFMFHLFKIRGLKFVLLKILIARGLIKYCDLGSSLYPHACRELLTGKGIVKQLHQCIQF